MKQCIHDGFGLVRFGEKLSGPEYVERFLGEFRERKIEAELLTFVTKMEKKDGVFALTAVDRRGVQQYMAKALVLATGCRERTAKQVQIHGTRPAGIMTAGTAQHFVNLQGKMPTERCVILGSGDIGLIMARRLTLEGARVLGVYEVKPRALGTYEKYCTMPGGLRYSSSFVPYGHKSIRGGTTDGSRGGGSG